MKHVPPPVTTYSPGFDKTQGPTMLPDTIGQFVRKEDFDRIQTQFEALKVKAAIRKKHLTQMQAANLRYKAEAKGAQRHQTRLREKLDDLYERDAREYEAHKPDRCPVCRASGDENVQLWRTEQLFDGGVCTIGYSIQCVNCGVHLENESLEELANLWNGRPDVQDMVQNLDLLNVLETKEKE